MNATHPVIAHPVDPPSVLATSRSTSPSSIYGQVTIFLALAYVGVIAVSLALPGTVADPGPAPVVALFVPAAVVGFLAVLRRGAPTGRHPLGLRRLGLSGVPAAVVLPVLAIGGPFVLADLLGIVRIVDVAGYLTNAPIQPRVAHVLGVG